MNRDDRPTLPTWLRAMADRRHERVAGDAAPSALPPLSAVAVFAAPLPAELCRAGLVLPGVAASVLPELPDFLSPTSELAVAMTEVERRAAMSAKTGLLLYCAGTTPTADGRATLVEAIRVCHERGALATALPAARKIIGPSVLAATSQMSAAGADSGLLRLLTQFHVVHDGRHVWSHTHGMAHYGLPDLECRTLVGDSELAARLLEAGIAGLLAEGEAALPPGGLLEASEADGRLLARFEVRHARRVEGHDYDAWGALELVPEAPCTGHGVTEECEMTTRLELDRLVGPGCRAQDLDLQGMDLRRRDFGALNGDRLDFSAADLRGALLKGVRFGGCRLQAAILEDSDWSAATLRICTLENARAARARFDATTLEDSSAKGIDLSGASLREARLSETNFERAVLREAVLDSASGAGMVFRGADLSGASLRKVQFEDADFRGADLRGADLSGGRFHHADFRGALLDGANFEATDCQGAAFDREEAPPTMVAADGLGKMAFGDLETLVTDLARQLETGGAPQSALLSSLLQRAGLQQTGEVAPEQAAMLRRLLETLRELQAPVANPEELVKRCQAMLQEVLPELGDTLKDADWQALSRLLAGLQDEDTPPR